MIKIISKETTELDCHTLYEELKNYSGIKFEDKEDWFFLYDLVYDDYRMEYSQSSGRGEICGITINTISKNNLLPLKLTDNTFNNKKIILKLYEHSSVNLSPYKNGIKFIQKKK